MATAQPDDVLRYGAVVPAPTEARVLSRIPWSGLVPLLLCAGTVALTFRSGGFFAGDTALAVVVLGLALVLWVTLVNRPFEALTAPLAIAIAALVLFAVWALLSQSWSHSPSRAVIESDRTLLYVLAVILFGLASASRAVRRAMPLVIPLAFVAVSICGLITRLLPDVWGISNSLAFERLSYPISYWNAQGMIAALAIVSALHLAASGREHRVIRALAAASVAPAACALLLTFSRGAIAVLPVGIIAYLLLARPARAASALVATVPTAAVAVALTYRSDALVNAVAPDPTMISQGKSAAVVVVACAVAAAALVLALTSLDASVATPSADAAFAGPRRRRRARARGGRRRAGAVAATARRGSRRPACACGAGQSERQHAPTSDEHQRQRPRRSVSGRAACICRSASDRQRRRHISAAVRTAPQDLSGGQRRPLALPGDDGRDGHRRAGSGAGGDRQPACWHAAATARRPRDRRRRLCADADVGATRRNRLGLGDAGADAAGAGVRGVGAVCPEGLQRRWPSIRGRMVSCGC